MVYEAIWHNDPTRPMVTLKTSWNNARKKAEVRGRWHDNRHTLVTDLAESSAAADLAGPAQCALAMASALKRSRNGRDYVEHCSSSASAATGSQEQTIAVQRMNPSLIRLEHLSDALSNCMKRPFRSVWSFPASAWSAPQNCSTFASSSPFGGVSG